MNTNGSQSTFVTILAWIFIVLAGFMTTISILQNIMIAIMFPIEEMNEAFRQADQEEVPAFFRFMASNIRLFFFAFLVASATTLASAIGLLKRKNWARLVFIALMGLGIVWTFFAVAMMFVMPHFVPDMPDDEFASHFNLMFNIIRVFNLIFALGFCVLFGWIVKKMMSVPIKAEFLRAEGRGENAD